MSRLLGRRATRIMRRVAAHLECRGSKRDHSLGR
jgi:hypothetical protein